MEIIADPPRWFHCVQIPRREGMCWPLRLNGRGKKSAFLILFEGQVEDNGDSGVIGHGENPTLLHRSNSISIREICFKSPK